RQRVHRAAVAKREVRRDLPEGLPERVGVRAGAQSLLRVLQHPATSLVARAAYTSGGLRGMKLKGEPKDDRLTRNRSSQWENLTSDSAPRGVAAARGLWGARGPLG